MPSISDIKKCKRLGDLKMQEIRGFVFFEGKNQEEIRRGFNGFKLDSLKYSLFDSFPRNGSYSEDSGIFIYGEVDEKYTSADITNILRRHIGMEESRFEEKKLINGKTHYTPVSGICDVSIAREDNIMNQIKANNGKRIEGNYFGIRIKPPLSLPEVEEKAKNLGMSIGAKDVYLRGVEIDEEVKELPKVCIEMVTNMLYDKAMKRIEKALNHRLNVEDIRAARLFV